jgi:hypothetical protein
VALQDDPARERKYLPIFGDVEMKLNEIDYKAFKFGPVQKYLISKYLGSPNSPERVLQVSLALICYCYIKFHSDIFFQREQGYWKNMIDTLAILLLEFQGIYSVKRFDGDANFLSVSP